MPVFRRRPLLRAAMVGGTAYYAGKHMERGREQDAQQDQEIAGLQAQQQQPQHAQGPPGPAPAPAPASARAPTTVDQLTQLKALLDAGVLTQAEFEDQKRKILQGG